MLLVPDAGSIGHSWHTEMQSELQNSSICGGGDELHPNIGDTLSAL